MPSFSSPSVAYETVKDFLENRDDMKVHFVFHNDEDKEIFLKTVQGEC